MESPSISDSAERIADNTQSEVANDVEIEEFVTDNEVVTDNINSEYVAPTTQSPEKKSRFGWGFLIGLLSGLFICAIGCYVCYCTNIISLNSQSENANETETTLEAESDTTNVASSNQLNSLAVPADSLNSGGVANHVDSEGSDVSEIKSEAAEKEEISDKAREEAVPTQPSDKKVYDTITKTRYLTTMAKQYYGNFHLWPYIYMENEAILGHPDRIKPGTKVVIPSLSKYGVDPNNPADIAKAKKKGVEIYSRYK